MVYVADLPALQQGQLCPDCVPPVLMAAVMDETWYERLSGRLARGPHKLRILAPIDSPREWEQFSRKDGCMHTLAGHPPQWWGVDRVNAAPVEVMAPVSP
jgi:hypothetical protein